MPNSLRSKIKHLTYKGEFNEREKDRLLSALDHEVDITYVCDGKKCPECSKLCNHTTDISHAVNFEPVMSMDGKTILNYEEKMPRYKPIILQEHDAEPRTLRAILDTAIKALEQEPCEDCISREEAIRIAEQGQIQGYEWQFKKLCNLPSVTPSYNSIKTELEQTRWIPVSERMPEDGQDVLFCDIDEDVMMGHHVKGAPDTHFTQQGSYEVIKNILAWMPLPEPYKAESEDENERG